VIEISAAEYEQTDREPARGMETPTASDCERRGRDKALVALDGDLRRKLARTQELLKEKLRAQGIEGLQFELFLSTLDLQRRDFRV